MSLRVGIIGDLHAYWDEIDVAQIDSLNYDLVFFIGDLGGGTRKSTLRMARLIAQLQTPTLVLPGNHDTWDLDEIRAELAHRKGIRALTSIHRGESSTEESVQLCGYSRHRLTNGAVDVTLIVGRPHSLGGPELSYPEYMADVYGVSSMAQSEERLRNLVDEAETRDLLFFAHNGPHGLGAAADDIWGCDFKPEAGDWGDADLAAAIDYAQSKAHNVLGVVAGHMHLRTKAGVIRPWKMVQEQIEYINAARVPRIYDGPEGICRQHISLTVDATKVAFDEVVLN